MLKKEETDGLSYKQKIKVLGKMTEGRTLAMSSYFCGEK